MHGIWMNVEIKPAPWFEQETGHVVAQTSSPIARICEEQGDAPLPRRHYSRLSPLMP